MSKISILGKTVKISSTGASAQDMSGALTELAATVTAGKKLLAQSLISKGVQNISHTDNLTRMAQAVDALDGAGNGLDAKIPLLILPKAISGYIGIDDSQLTATNREWRKLPGKPNIICRNYNSGVRLADTAGKTFDGTEPVDLDITISSIRTALGLASSDLTFTAYPKFWYDSATTSFILITNDLKAVKITVSFNEVLAQSTWTAQLLQSSLTSSDGNAISGDVHIICYNAAQNKAVVYSSYFYLVDLASGSYTRFTWPKNVNTYSTPPVFYGYDYGGVSAFVYNERSSSAKPFTVFFIDWADPSQSDYVDTEEAFPPQAGFVFDYENGKILTSNFGEFDLSQRTYTPGISVNRSMCGNGESSSGSRDSTFARITASNGDILQLDSWCVFTVFSSDKTQRLLPGGKAGQAAAWSSTYGMGTPSGYYSYMTLGHVMEIDGKICICDDGNIYEAIIDYTRFICWPLTRNGTTVYLRPVEKITYEDFMSATSPLLRASVVLPVDVSGGAEEADAETA